MGYLSQKKHKIRENIFLYIMAVVLTVLTAGLFINPGFCYGFFNLFHLYCLSAILMLYTVFVGKYKEAVFFATVLTICYTVLGASGNIFFSDRFDGSQTVELQFDDKSVLAKEFSKDKQSSGSLIVARHYISPYVVINKGGLLTIVKVDFRKAGAKEYPLIFEHLREFILKQDNPVIIFGEFGIPSWNRSFKRFLDASGLSVKNRLLFTEGSRFNIFSVPGFYVLGFREMGIKGIKIHEHEKSTDIMVKVSFNPAQI